MKFLLIALLAAPVYADDGDTITIPHDVAARQLAKYMQVLAEMDKLADENAKLKSRMEICWAGYGGFKQ